MLGEQFSQESHQLPGLLARRDANNTRAVSWQNGFLDDCLGGIYPDDLIVVGAATGVGKTALAVSLAFSAAVAGVDPVYLFALEAEVGEVSARVAFSEIAKRTNRPMDFAGWWRGRYPEVDSQHWEDVERVLSLPLGRVRTLYKKAGDFTVRNLQQQLEAIAHDAKLVIVDHLHVVDAEGVNPNTVQYRTIRLLRDFTLTRGIPVVALSHLRKRQATERGLVMPDIDDLHGTSELSKVATGVVLVARDWEGEAPARYLSPTFLQVTKDRRGRASPYVARCFYNGRLGAYESGYELGRIGWVERKQTWQLTQYPPEWSRTRSNNTTQEQPF